MATGFGLSHAPSPPGYGTGGRRLKIVFAAVIGSYAVAFAVGAANGHFGWWGEERLQRELREQALAQLDSAANDPACLPQDLRLHATFGTVSRVSFIKELDRPLPAIVAQQRIVCAGAQGRRVAERWILLARPDTDETPACLAVGRKDEVDKAIRRCGFVMRRLS